MLQGLEAHQHTRLLSCLLLQIHVHVVESILRPRQVVLLRMDVGARYAGLASLLMERIKLGLDAHQSLQSENFAHSIAQQISYAT